MPVASAAEPPRRPPPRGQSITTRAFDRWVGTLDRETGLRVAAARRRIERVGPTAGRPFVGVVSGSRFPNMKELRIGRTGRVLMAFDPSRTPVLLVGGDKAGSAKRWYRENIPRADRLYASHLRRFGRGDQWPNRTTRRPPPDRGR